MQASGETALASVLRGLHHVLCCRRNQHAPVYVLVIHLFPLDVVLFCTRRLLFLSAVCRKTYKHHTRGARTRLV